MRIDLLTLKILVPVLLALAAVPAAAQEEEEKYITIAAKQMDVQSFFQLLNRQYDLNIVVSKDVTGPMTVLIKDIPLEQALKVITSSHGLSYKRNGEIIQVFPAGKAEAETPAVKPAARLDLESRFFQLKFVEAISIAPLIEPLLTPGAGLCSGIKEGNLLMVRDLPQRIAEISEIVAQLDAESHQVRISVKIVLINRTDSEAAGFDWFTSFRASGAKRPIIFPFDKEHSGGGYWPENNPFGGEEGDGSEFSPDSSFPYATKDDFVFGVLDATEFSLLMQFIDSKMDSELISQPEITTVNNKTAKIINGNIVQIPTYSQNLQYGITTVSGYQEIETGTNLEVTPRIIDEKSILLKVIPEVSEIVEYRGQFDELPNIATRKADTEVILEDGKTLIIGGLVRTIKREKETGVPFLKDIPLLGYLFRYSSEEIEKDDMVIFITPRIIDREALRKEAEGMTRHDGRWVPQRSFDVASRLKAALFGPSPDQRMRGIHVLARMRNEEILSIVEAEDALVRVMENDESDEIRVAATRVLANRFPDAFYTWLESMVLADPNGYRTGFLVRHALLEPARHLRDLSLMAAMMVNRDESMQALLKGLDEGDTRIKIRAAEAFCRFPCLDAQQALIRAVGSEKDPAARYYALFALSRCGHRHTAEHLLDVATAAKETPLGGAALEALDHLESRNDFDSPQWNFETSDFSCLVARLREAKTPAVIGSVPFQSRVSSALALLEIRAPQYLDLLRSTTEEIVESNSWNAENGSVSRIVVSGDDVTNWPVDRIAFEIVFFSSLLYQNSGIPAGTGIDKILEGSRDQFWAVYSLAEVSVPPDSRLRRFISKCLDARGQREEEARFAAPPDGGGGSHRIAGAKR